MFTRMRRLRSSERMRAMVRETHVSVEQLILPVFVCEGEGIKEEIPSMPGQYRYSVDMLDELITEVGDYGLAGVLLFGIPDKKDEFASEAYNDEGVVQRAIKKIKRTDGRILVVADVCLCEYTSHGHCGIICGNEILNDETLPYLVKMSVSLARAGADIIAPSDMMDGRVRAIREGLDENGFKSVAIMAYSAKFASGYYSPFRDAADSAPSFGDRKTYQMDPANRKMARREWQADIAEGADIIMVKPALSYLDVVREAADSVDLPVAVYNVSGEYAMVKAAAEKGWIDEERIVMENMISMRRAGADIIITYHALDVAKMLLGR